MSGKGGIGDRAARSNHPKSDLTVSHARNVFKIWVGPSFPLPAITPPARARPRPRPPSARSEPARRQISRG